MLPPTPPKPFSPIIADRSSSSPSAVPEAFSLVEVVLAIGLVMFAALVIFSLLPVGLASLQDSNRQIVETEIFNTVDAELSATAFTNMTNYQATRFPIYFSNEGMEVNDAASSAFIVRCDPPIAEPGGELNRMKVSIGFHRDPTQPGNSNKISRRTFLVVNRGL